MKSVNIDVFGVHCRLVMTCGCMFDIIDQYGDDWIDRINTRTRESMSIAVGVFCRMSATCEKLLQSSGYAPSAVPEPSWLENRLTDSDGYELSRIKEAVFSAVTLSLTRTVESEGTDETDLVLQEIDSKNVGSTAARE